MGSPGRVVIVMRSGLGVGCRGVGGEIGVVVVERVRGGEERGGDEREDREDRGDGGMGAGARHGRSVRGADGRVKSFCKSFA